MIDAMSLADPITSAVAALGGALGGGGMTAWIIKTVAVRWLDAHAKVHEKSDARERSMMVSIGVIESNVLAAKEVQRRQVEDHDAITSMSVTVAEHGKDVDAAHTKIRDLDSAREIHERRISILEETPSKH